MPVLTKAQMKKVLSKNNLIAHIGTVRPDGYPYVNAIWYRFDGKHLYLISRTRGKHVDHLKKNNKISFYVDTMPDITRILILGKAEIIEEGPLKNLPFGSKLMVDMTTSYLGAEGMKKYGQKSMGYPRSIVKITPREWHGWTGYDWPKFHQK